MKYVVLAVALCVFGPNCPVSHAKSPDIQRTFPNTSIPYVVTRNDTVRDMLWLADVGKDDVVYDLGSGDGRIVISAVRDFGAQRAVGIEIDLNLIQQSRINAQKAGVGDKAEFIQDDLFDADFSEASVVALYLGHKANIRLRPKLIRTLRPGSRIISHQFAMGEWTPAKELTINKVQLGMIGEAPGPFDSNPQVPDYTGNEPHFGRSDKVFMWVVPAPIAGLWRGKIKRPQGEQDIKLILHQTPSGVNGTFELSGQTDFAGKVRVDLWGDHLRFWCSPDGKGYGDWQIIFDGSVHGDIIKGKVVEIGNNGFNEYEFQAVRDKADLTGTWEWPSASKPHQVKLRIENHDNQLTATYLDRDRGVPVTDFYNFGGGFYFTVLVGFEENTFEFIDGPEDAGWLIGEGTLDDGMLNGTVMLYPYSMRRKNTPPVIREWNSKKEPALLSGALGTEAVRGKVMLKSARASAVNSDFETDSQLIGTWRSVDFVSEVNEFQAGTKRWAGDLFLKELEFKENGRTSISSIWTKDWICQTKAQYYTKTINGEIHLFFPWLSGDVTIRGMKPAYYVLKKTYQ
ncbi:MAG: methyltransferase domain-containing protein [Planctomycetota bacterium]|jgi:precorrin-6B methylase 2